jgi:hypothetical protein
MRRYALASLCWLRQKSIHLVVLIFLSGGLACSRKSGTHYLIPQDADFVMAVNMQQMVLKSLSQAADLPEKTQY